MNIAFFGTSDFAKIVLEHLNNSGFNVVLVVTREDAKKDRGQKLSPPPVKIYAQSELLNVVQPHTLKDNEEFESYFRSLNIDIVCVAAYGKILPSYIIACPKYGCLNVHGSVLPKYRGAAPIQRSIMDGVRPGITIMQMDEGLDTGDMIVSSHININDNDNFETISVSLAHLGARLLIDVINNLNSSKYSPTPQDNSEATYAPKITDEDKKINFNESAKVCFNRIRALYPDNCAYCILNGEKIKITNSRVSAVSPNGAPGSIYSLSGKGDGWIEVNTNENVLRIISLIPPGKKEMTAGDFVRGRKITINDNLS